MISVLRNALQDIKHNKPGRTVLKLDEYFNFYFSENIDVNMLVAELLEALESNTTLTKVTVDTCPMEDQHFIAIATALENNRIQNLLIRYTNIGDEGFTSLVKSFKNNMNFKTLIVEHNRIGELSARYVSDFLYGENREATDMFIHILQPYIGEEGAKYYSKFVAAYIPLEEIMLSYNKIGDEGAKAFGNALAHNYSLRELHLTCTGISAKGTKFLANALNTNKRLICLFLDSNYICDQGAIHLAEALGNQFSHHSALSELHLAYTGITAKGMKSLANALITNKTLKVLDLGGNKIGDEGAKELGNVLALNCTLRVLFLSGTGITTQGMTSLANGLITNKSLKTLNLSGNKIGDEGAKILAKALAKSNTLECLVLRNAGLTPRGMYILEKVEKKRENLCVSDI